VEEGFNVARMRWEKIYIKQKNAKKIDRVKLK